MFESLHLRKMQYLHLFVNFSSVRHISALLSLRCPEKNNLSRQINVHAATKRVTVNSVLVLLNFVLCSMTHRCIGLYYQ